MDCNGRSKFSWSFTGFKSEEQAKKELLSMEAWFSTTFAPANEWQIVTSLSQTPFGYRAALSAERTVVEEVKDGLD